MNSPRSWSYAAFLVVTAAACSAPATASPAGPADPAPAVTQVQSTMVEHGRLQSTTTNRAKPVPTVTRVVRVPVPGPTTTVVAAAGQSTVPCYESGGEVSPVWISTTSPVVTTCGVTFTKHVPFYLGTYMTLTAPDGTATNFNLTNG